MSKNKLIKSSMTYTLGNLLLQGLNFITLPIYTRVISQEVFGQYSLYTSWVAIFALFIGLQTSGSFTTAKVKFEHEYESYVSHCLSISTLFFICCGGLVFLFRGVLAPWIGVSESILLVMVIQSYLMYVTGLLGIYFISYQRATMNLFLSGFVAITTISLSLFLVFRWSDDFFARVIGGFIPLVLSAIVVIFYVYRRGKTFVRKDFLRFSLVVSIPLIFHHLGHQILNQMDRIMIGHMMTATDVALYSFGYNLGLIMSLVLMNLNTAWTPWFFEQKKMQNSKLPFYVQRYLAIALFLTMGYLTIYPELAILMGGRSYADSIKFIPLIIISYFFSFLYTFPVNIQFYHANTKMIPVGTLMAGGLNIILNFILIPIIGIYGAAFATVLSYLALLAFHHVISKRMYGYVDVSAKTHIFLLVIVSSYAGVMGLTVEQPVLRYFIGLIVIWGYAYYFKSDILVFSKRLKKRFTNFRLRRGS